MYVGPTLFIPCGCLVIQPVSFGFSSFAKRLPTRYSILNKGKSPTVPGPDCTEDARMSHWNCSRSKACVCRAYADVHCYETEQFHARACLFGKITLDLIGLQETNNTSHLTVGGTVNRHSHLCTYHVTRSGVQLHEALFNIALNTRNQ